MTKLRNSKFSPCLEVNTLMDFVQNNLIGKECQVVKNHLEDCAYCQDRVEDLEVFYKEPVPQDNEYDYHQKSIKQALHKATWKIYLQKKLEIAQKQVGQIVHNFVQPKFAFPILATFLAVFIFINIENVDSVPQKANKTNRNPTTASWKYSAADDFGVGVDVDFWQRKIFLTSSTSDLEDKGKGYRSYPRLLTFS